MNTRRHSCARLEIKAGDTYGMFTIIGEASPAFKPSGIPVRTMNCRCQCGTEKTVRLSSLRDGTTVSCGCYHRANAGKILKNAVTTHGQSRKPIYSVWRGMISRCHNEADKSYPRYGARGIQVCAEWRSSFESFFAHIGERPEGLTIDRINSKGNYEPGNVRWATYKQQARNTSRNHLPTINGETKCLAEWCEILNEPWTTVKKRVAVGHDPFTRMRPDRRLYANK